jgi:glutaredoxin
MWRWLRRWRRARPAARVVLYHRAGCHLCDDARTLLDRERLRHGFALDVVDVDTESGLADAYGEHVPVIAVNGRVRFRGVINLVLLRRLLASGR